MSSPRDPRPNAWQQVQSVFAAFFGVQSRRNRERDFKHGKPINFVIIGLAMTLLFVLAVVLAVKFALRLAGVA